MTWTSINVENNLQQKWKAEYYISNNYYYMAASNRDWKALDSRIWSAEINIKFSHLDRHLDQ